MPLKPQRSQFRQLADQLRAGIERGEYPAGSLLPSEPELVRLYGVSRQTANRAIMVLRGEGLVRVKRGVGVIVREIPAISRDAMARYQRSAREHAGSRGAFDNEIRRLGMTPRSDLEVSRIPAPADIAESLQIPENSPVIMRKRKMYANDYPVQLAPSYIPADLADGTPLAEHDSGPGGIISRFKDLGLEQVRITETIRIRRAADEEREFLRLEEEQPVLQITHIGWTAGDRPVEVCVHCVPAFLWILNYEWRIEDQ